MRRTYRSKKETAGAIDPRDVLFTIDAKSSVFDAFYIQNIKQTKRDMSVGSTMQFAASNKVRKRKYVKRLKEQETLCRTRESTSSSAFLTPDKSFRVNKPPDLFDQLLNSSNNTPEPVPLYNKPTFQRRTYIKKQINKNNINYSSSESTDSDKENSCSSEVNKTANSSDIKSHKLLIEREIKNSPEYNDKSINDVVNNISIFSHLRNPTQTPNTKQKHLMPYNKITQNSPLCSTPFHDKYRGASIYRFSPISINLDDSPKEKTAIKNNEEQNDFSYKEENVDNIEQDTEAVKIENPESRSCQDSINERDDTKTNTLNESQYKSICPTDNHSPILSNPTITKRNRIKTIKNSLSFQTTEIESFHGFGDSDIHCNDLDAIREKYKEIENILTEDNSHNETSETLQEDENSHANGSTNSDSDASFISGSESNYDTCNSEDDFNEFKQLGQPVVVVERLNDSIFNKYYELMPKSESLNSDYSTDFNDSYNNSNITDSLSVSDNCDDIDLVENVPDMTSINLSDCSNTCNDNKMDEEVCVSFVTTRRRILPNDSIILDVDSSVTDSSGSDADKTVLRKSVDDSSNLQLKSEHAENMLDNNKEIERDGAVSLNSELHTEDVDQLKTLPEPPRMVTRKSARMILKTDTTSINCARNIERNSRIDGNIKDMSETETNILNISKEKPSIVLQPGKRWERSLSIYRRMTTMENFDKTILDEEQLQNKGRKYRQSVIATMELQEKGSLHNDSIKSRRSTFVSKPSRSTIKIESDLSRDSLCSTIVCEDLQGFLGEDCDDTIVELSKLSIADSEHEVTLIEKFHDTSNRIATARDYVLRRCNQTDVLLFDECYPDPLLKNCRKIGEGVYGEVFLWRARDGRARVLKVIPIAGDIKVNGEEQKGFHEILSEIVIAMELSALRAPIADITNHLNEGKSLETLDLHTVENATDVFNEVLSVRCVTGGYPSRLLDLWDLYDESKGSENDNPAVLPPDQQFIVLELANAGQDLESYQFVNAEQSYALFKQIAFGLAVAEEAFQFEHRDLHWGNVLIAQTDQKSSCFVVRGRAFNLPSCGVKASIIDYSLSRASVSRGVLYSDLAQDEALFEALGDYQFTVYRLMRDKLGNDWKNFEPYTNILWLHYTLDKMITALRYTRTNTKIHKHYIAKLKEVKNRILDYGSAVQFVLTDNEI
ncbi:uncharacterized protein LOC116769820 isoform X2 [Danaus plexippus]|uniref:uncharacterized protein LOC116769820 isoform X2 n=1 Tax=Danaus plexippus TaxID=13037 RepID=UPI002AB1CB81|nr:uncharacterized protein LOC116769820 isoform X2 [Danaus plexippus]